MSSSAFPFWRVASGTVLIRFQRCWWRLEDKSKRLPADHAGHDRQRSLPSDSIKLICFPKIRPRNLKINLLSWDHTQKQWCSPCSCIVGSTLIARGGLCLSWGRHLLVGSTSKHGFTPDVSPPCWGFHTSPENVCSGRYFGLQGLISFPLLGGKIWCTQWVLAYQRLWNNKQQQQRKFSFA